MANLLIVDDEKNIRRTLATYFESCGHHVQMAESAPRALAILAENPDVDLVLSDYRMAEMNGLELLHEIKARFPKVLTILITAYATVESAVEAMKSGAYDYLAKPFSLDQIGHVVDRALEVKALRSENQALRETIDEVPLLDSKSPAMTALLDIARQAANSEATILLTGESGTGKNVLARQIHLWSPRRERPFVVVNCTTLSEHLLESELFGHVRGAFTGAVKDKPGRLEAAQGGSVFLDEIADLPAPIQTKFLRFLQEQRFERLGDQKTIQVDARIIAASNRDLQQEVAAGRFRPDLFYRLNVITLGLPALRDRARGRGRAGRTAAGCGAHAQSPSRLAALARGDRGDYGLSMAGQRARASQRDRARHRLEPRRSDHQGGSAGLDLSARAGDAAFALRSFFGRDRRGAHQAGAR